MRCPAFATLRVFLVVSDCSKLKICLKLSILWSSGSKNVQKFFTFFGILFTVQYSEVCESISVNIENQKFLLILTIRDGSTRGIQIPSAFHPLTNYCNAV